MISAHLFNQIYVLLFAQNDSIPPKCGELSEYTDTAHSEVAGLSLSCMNGCIKLTIIFFPTGKMIGRKQGRKCFI